MVSLALLTISGCSELLTFHFSGTIRDAATGAPLEGVAIALEVSYARNPPTPNEASHSLAIDVANRHLKSDKNGRIAFDLEVVDREISYRSPLWSFVFSKPGYNSRKVTIAPTASGNPASKVFDVDLKPAES